MVKSNPKSKQPSTRGEKSKRVEVFGKATLPKSVSFYYNNAPSPQRETMLEIRRRILSIIPQATEVISYGMPAFQISNGNKPFKVAGLLANKLHVGYYPFSGSILELFPNEIKSFKHTKSALHVPVDTPLDLTLLKLLIEARLKEGGH